jgi:hypothetical protein
MELILLSVRLVYWLFVAPVWWISTYLASAFYSYEGDTGYLVLSLIFSALIAAGIVTACIMLTA